MSHNPPKDATPKEKRSLMDALKKWYQSGCKRAAVLLSLVLLSPTVTATLNQNMEAVIDAEVRACAALEIEGVTDENLYKCEIRTIDQAIKILRDRIGNA